MNFSKMIKQPNQDLFNVLLGLGVIVLIVVLVQYNQKKSPSEALSNSASSFSPSNYPDVSPIKGGPSNAEIGSAASLKNDNYLEVSGIATPRTNNADSVNTRMTPNELLPSQRDNEWSSLNPASDDLTNVNLLSAGQIIGINTVGSSMRNANLQLRSEFPIPRQNVGPWNESTIEPDTMRRGLEIGSTE
jgi:hypothetical protein